MTTEIDYYSTMISKIKSFVNAKGSSLTFSAQGGRDKEKILKPAEKIASPNEAPPPRAVKHGANGFFQEFLIK